MITTRELFDNWLPAFRTPSGDIYTKLAPYITNIEDTSLQRLRPTYATTREEEHLIARAATLRAAYLLTPQLDLVLTPTGFGIVSNQNTAPASRERVTALREELRHSASRAEEQMHRHFFAVQAYELPELIAVNLLWAPSLATAYGITTTDHQPLYREELQALRAPIEAAQAKVAEHISPELVHTLVTNQYAPATAPDRASLLKALTHDARLAMAALITHEPPAVVNLHLRNLQLRADTHLSALPEYQNSATYRAQHVPPYENKQEDTAFFFG